MKRERQSGIRYLKTERDIGAEMGTIIRCPIRLFDLQGLGIDQERFLMDLAPSFHELAWDPYDARRERVQFLLDRFPEEQVRLEQFRETYYREGDAALEDVRDLLRRLAWSERYRFDKLRSYRRRSIASFVVTNRFSATWEDQWHVKRTRIEGFAQDVEEDDSRSLVRVFDETSVKVVENIGFQRLLVAVAEMVEDAEAEFDLEPGEMELTFHQMSLPARPGEEVSNAPEGRHKDGADYIVSALVVERSNIAGGVSVVTSDDPQRVLLEHTLQPGEGLFQADVNSSLWHDVTPARLLDIESSEVGVRNIFGFDIVVTRRVPRER